MYPEMNDPIVNYTRFLEDEDLLKLEENLVDVTILLRMKCDLLQNLLSVYLAGGSTLTSSDVDKRKFSFLLMEAFRSMDILPKIQVNMADLNLVSV